MMAEDARKPTKTQGNSPTVGELVRVIRDAIMNGDYAPNQRMIEADLSAMLGASRAVVRSALIELAADRLIDRMPNRGSRVRAVTVADAIEILEVRVGLEALCSAKAAELISDEEVVEFKQLRADILSSVADGDLMEYSRLNQRLDLRIREVSRHAAASSILERLRAQGVRHQFRLAFQPGRAAVSAPEHAAIID